MHEYARRPGFRAPLLASALQPRAIRRP
jgi:hypothetical protein